MSSLKKTIYHGRTTLNKDPEKHGTQYASLDGHAGLRAVAGFRWYFTSTDEVPLQKWVQIKDLARNNIKALYPKYRGKGFMVTASIHFTAGYNGYVDLVVYEKEEEAHPSGKS